MQLEMDKQTRAAGIRKLLQVKDRKFTPGEEKMVMQWLDWGFGEAEIGKAYEKTCMNTGGLRWPYLNSILRSWHEQGLHTVQAIEAGDKTPKGAAQTRNPGQMGQMEQDAIRRMMQTQEE